MLNSLNLLTFAIAVIILLSGCTNTSEENDTNSHALPDKASLDFVERFRISDPIEDVSFRYIQKIHVLSDGNLIVLNGGDYRLYEFTTDGEFVSAIGDYGRGPGEFIQITNSLVTAGDTLHVMGSEQKHKVFARTADGTWEFIRERTINFMPSEDLQQRIPYDDVLTDSNGNLYGIYRGYHDSMGGQYSYVSSISHDLEQTGGVSRPFLIVDLAFIDPDGINLVMGNARFLNSFYSYLPDSDQVILIRNNSNEIISIDASNNEKILGYLPFEHLPINEQEVNNLYDRFRNDFPGAITVLSSKLLDHEPYYWRVLLNDKRLFVHFERSEKDKPNWAITTLEGEILGSFHVPMNIQQLAVNGDYLFVSTTGEDGTVYLAGFDLVSVDR